MKSRGVLALGLAVLLLGVLAPTAHAEGYDADRDGLISMDEVLAAVWDYFDGAIERNEVIGVVRLYFSQDPVPTLVDGLPTCRVGRSERPTIDMGVQLFGCYSKGARVYLSESMPDYTLADVEWAIENVNADLAYTLGIDAASFDAPAIYLVNTEEELDAVKGHLNGAVFASGWFGCCGEYAGIYVGLQTAASLTSALAHEYTHYLLYQEYGDNRPSWLEEGTATYYEERSGHRNPSAELYRAAASVYYALLHDDLEPLQSLEGWLGSDRDRVHLRYQTGHMAVLYIIETYGYSKLAEILRLAAGGEDTSRKIPAAFGKSYADFDIGFRYWLVSWAESDDVIQAMVNNTGGALFCFPPRCTSFASQQMGEWESVEIWATFTNPTTVGPFEYGFRFDSSPETDVSYDTTFYVSSLPSGAGLWRAFIGRAYGPSISEEYRNKNWRDIELANGLIDGDIPFDDSPGGANTLRTTVTAGEGCLYLNGKLVSCLELPELGVMTAVGTESVQGDVWYNYLTVTPIEGPIVTSAPLDEALDYFLEIALEVEYGSREPVIVKWMTDPTIQIHGTPTVGDRAFLYRVVSELNELVGDITLRLVEENAAIDIHFVPVSQFPSILPNYIPPIRGSFLCGGAIRLYSMR